MKTHILYATKSGGTRECAELLAARITGSSVYDLSKGAPDIGDADMIIIGAGVRMGRVYKPARVLIEKNLEKLLAKRIALFLCNGEPEAFSKAIEKNIPAQLVSHALCVTSFGGKIPFSSTKNQDWMLMDNIKAFIQTMEQSE